MVIDLVSDLEYSPSGVVYLASPYNHSDWIVRDRRFREICDVARRLINRGIYVYSPIAHNHPIAVSGSLSPSWEFWCGFDTAMLKLCSELWVCKIEGWRISKGIAAEIQIASSDGKSIKYLDPLTLHLRQAP